MIFKDMKSGIFFKKLFGLLNTMVFLTLGVICFDYLYHSVFKISFNNQAAVFMTDVDEKVIPLPLEEEEKEKFIQIAFVGDMMLDRGVAYQVNKNGEGDFDFVFKNISDSLKKYDLVFGNLEGPVSDKGKDEGGIYSFRMSPDIVPILKENKFDALTIANNHINNWGIEAIIDTIERCRKNNILVTGAGLNTEDAYSPKVLEMGNTKIAFLSYSEFGKYYEAQEDSPGVAMISEEALKIGIEKAMQESDIVIVNFHFGEEYQLEENSYQHKYAHMAIDLGANLVIGHHPHVVQPIEKYRNSYIAYSLGNFIFDQYFSEETMQGGLLEVDIENKTIKNVNLKKVKINNHFQPSLE
jgi:poly-gamma-glutamate synthesis protein (capsule biosynthesis protein)